MRSAKRCARGEVSDLLTIAVISLKNTITELYMTIDLLSILVPHNRIELLPTDYETVVLPLN